MEPKWRLFPNLCKYILDVMTPCRINGTINSLEKQLQKESIP